MSQDTMVNRIRQMIRNKSPCQAALIHADCANNSHQYYVITLWSHASSKSTLINSKTGKSKQTRIANYKQ